MEVETCHGCNGFAEDVETEVLVGRVDSVALKSEAHQDGFHTKHTFKLADDGMLPPRRTASGRLPKASVNPSSAAL